MRGIALAAMFGMFLLAPKAFAADVKFCFKVYGDYSDAGVPLRNGLSEDYWTNGTQAQVFRGGKYQIRLGSSSGTLLASGYLGDGIGSGDPGSGCSTTISLSNVNQTYWYRIDSEASINLNTMVGREDDSGTTCYRATTYSVILGPGTYNLTLSGNSEDCKDVFRALNSSGFSMYRHNGGNSGVTFTVRTRCVSCSNETSGTTTYLTDAGSNRKFTASHEMGHALGNARDGEITWGDCSQDDSKCPSGGTGGSSHAMASREQAKCAFREALAHFYAADTYNGHSEADCAFNYYKPYYPSVPDLDEHVVDCDGAGSDLSALDSDNTQPAYEMYPIATMERLDPIPPDFSTPGCSTPWANRSVEVDYLRVLWNIHANGGPTFTEMMDWFEQSFNWLQSNCYNELDGTANTIGGTLKSRWDTNKVLFGVDHP